jgi:signal transduction histidine kinase
VFKRLSEEKTAKRYQKIIMATITHELRTPLNGILSMLELISPNLRTKEDILHLDIARNSSFLMQNLISDILDFSQIEANSLKIINKKFKLREIVESCMKLIQFEAENKGLDLRLEIKTNTPKYIISDENRYRQIILNLLSNALKFTQKGFIKIRIYYDVLNSQVITAIKDTGIGISQEDQTHLFKLYGKLHSSESMNPQGVFFFH